MERLEIKQFKPKQYEKYAKNLAVAHTADLINPVEVGSFGEQKLVQDIRQVCFSWDSPFPQHSIRPNIFLLFLRSLIVPRPGIIAVHHKFHWAAV